MGLVCNCPLGASISDVTVPECLQSFGQFQKGALQRVFSAAGTKNSIAEPATKASWTALLTAEDGTKIVPTPYLNAPETEVGAPKTWGGGNETLGGAEMIIGREATVFTGKLISMPQSTIKQLKEFQCENIGIWMFDEYGNIGCLVDDVETPTEYFPIPIVQNSFFVGDKKFGGVDEPDQNDIQWSFAPNVMDNFVILKPSDFNPLTDLAAGAGAE